MPESSPVALRMPGPTVSWLALWRGQLTACLLSKGWLWS